MGFLTTSSTGTTIQAYLTQLGRDYLVFGNPNKLIFEYFSIGDSDYNYENTTGKTENNLMPDFTGINDNCIISLSSNVDIKNNIPVTTGNTSVFLEPLLNSGSGFQKINVQFTGSTVVSGNSISFLLADRTNNSNELNHLFKSFNLPITETEKAKFDSDYSLTAIRNFNVDKILVIELKKGTYGEAIDGKSLDLIIPSGTTPSYISISSSFFKEENKELIDYNNQISDSNDFSQEFGYAKTDFDSLNTNIAYLFSDTIQTPISGDTWHNKDNFFYSTVSSGTTRNLAIFNDPINNDLVVNCQTGNVTTGEPINIDTSVGIAYLDKGFMVITNQSLISGFTEYVTTQGLENNITPYSLTGATSNVELVSFTNEFIQTGTAFLENEKFNSSNNPTYTTGKDVYFSEIGMFNIDEELIAIGKFSKPVKKNKNVNLTVDININL